MNVGPDHVLRVEREEYQGNYLLRLCPCECRPDCDTLIIMASQVTLRGLRGGQLPLWICCGITSRSHAEAAAAEVLESANSEPYVHKGLIVHGALWEKAGWRVAAQLQAAAWVAAPPEIIDLHDELLLRTRAVCMGGDFTRTVRALEAVAESYTPGGVQLAVGREAAYRVATSTQLSAVSNPDSGTWS